jgi:hypothetical protein
VSDIPLPNVGSTGVEIADSFSTPIALPARITKTTLAVRAFDSSPAYDSTTALGDVFTKAQSAAEDDADVCHGRRRF